MKAKQAFIQYKLHHVLIWLLVALTWFYLRFQDYSTTERAVTVTFIKTVDLAAMIYLCNYLLIPKLLYRKKYILFALGFLAMIVVSSILKMYLIGKITNNAALHQWTDNIKGRIYDNMLPHFFLVMAGVSIQLILDYSRMQKRLAEVAKEKAEAELNFLKSQINPHFLFNSINAVYFLIDKSNTEARNALHKFSDMLRYQLYEMKDERITIEKEVNYLKDYIGLQQLRSENCSVTLQVEPGMKSFLIEPLLLVPLVENSFKHISHYTDRQNQIRIDLSRPNGSMNFSIYNTTEGKGGREFGAAGGIGLANVKRRLELLYPGRHELQITERDDWFGVELSIKTASV